MSKGEKKDAFRSFIDGIEGWTEQTKNRYFFDWHIGGYERRSKELQRPYYKDVISQTEDGCVIIIYWAPNGGTRPHSHGGSPAKIHVLLGCLVQEVFKIGDMPPAKTAFRKNHFAHKAPNIIERPGVVHRVSNVLVTEWSISIHKFNRDFTMEIYDFEENLRWPVRGENDTTGDPESAVPIWLLP